MRKRCDRFPSPTSGLNSLLVDGISKMQKEKACPTGISVACQTSPLVSRESGNSVAPTCEMESNMAIYGYARVSTDGQSLVAQIGELKSAKSEKVFQEKISGARTDRKQLARLIAVLGACPNSRCSILSESDSSLSYEQVFSPLEYRSDTAAAAECAGLRAER